MSPSPASTVLVVFTAIFTLVCGLAYRRLWARLRGPEITPTGFGALQVRRFAREPWHGQWVEFARKGVPPVDGRGDVR